MSRQRVSLQRCYVLHHRPYRESSLLLELFGREEGRFGLVARGARGKRSKSAALLRPFQPLLVSWSSRGELGTLTGVESAGAPLILNGAPLISGFYLNELLMRTIARHDPHEELFDVYEETMAHLAGEGGEAELRLFEKRLLQELGYGLLLDCEARSGEPIEPERRYLYRLDQGPLEWSPDADEFELVLHGHTLLALEAEALEGGETLVEAKRLMRAALAPHLGGRPLKSRELFRSLYGGRSFGDRP